MNRINLPDNIKTCIIEHLEIVSAEFRSYFNDDTLHASWYRDPFNTEIDPNAEKAEELVEITVSSAMKLVFNNKIENFIIHIPLLSRKASIILVQFAITYLFEAGFSDLAFIKTKSRNHLNVCSGIRVARSKTEPNIKGLLRRAQEHTSH